MPPTIDDDAMTHSSSAMPNGDESFWTTPEVDNASDLFADDTTADDAAAFVTETDTEPDATLIEPKTRSNKAKSYEKKMRGLFRFGFNVTAQNPKTVPDAATILLYGPDISKAMGDLAAENAWAAKAVDMLTDGTDNAAAALLMASVPFVLQIIRNHEPVTDIQPHREIRIPFTQRTVSIKFRFKLRRFRQLTNPPDEITRHVFGNAKVQEALRKQGMSFQ